MKLRVEEDLKDQFKKDLERQDLDIIDREEQIQELKEIKAQLKEELFKREDKIDDLFKHIKLLEDQRTQLEGIVKEAD